MTTTRVIQENVLDPVDTIIGEWNTAIAFTFNAPGGTLFSQTGRLPIVAKGPFTRVKMITRNNSFSGVAETPTLYPCIEAATVECGVAYTTLQKSGKSVWVSDVNAAATPTEYGYISVPTGSTFYTRFHRRISKAPLSVTATASAGGVLATGVPVFYKITTMDNGLESFPSLEVTATPSSSNLAVTLAWTVPTYGDTLRIYRGTTTNAENFLVEIPATATGYVDFGYLQTAPGVIPPATQQTYQINTTGLFSAETTNSGVGQAQTNVTQATGSITGTSGPGFAYIVRPSFLVGDMAGTFSCVGLGDSILAGTGIFNVLLPQLNVWFNTGLRACGNINFVNSGFPSTTLQQLVQSLNQHTARLAPTQYTQNILCEHGTNDIFGSSTWDVLAGYHLQLAKTFYNENRRYFVTTLTPRTQTTTGFTTLAGQIVTLTGSYAQRILYNTWIRNGMQVDGSGNAVQSGGTPTIYIRGYFDLALQVEVDANGNSVPNGGYWKVPSSPQQSSTFAAGSTATVLNTVGTNTLNTLPGKVIAITSGALAGQFAQVSNNQNTTTQITVYATGATTETGLTVFGGLTGSPAAGDSYSIYNTITIDGVHPSLAGSNLISPGYQAWATTNIVS